MGNTFGHLFRVTTWGESHGAAIGVVIDGCPPLLPLSEADIQPDLDRRAPGQSALVTQRKESDTVRILSGVFEGKTLGTPVSLAIDNEDMRPGDYREVQQKYRPSHADYTYEAKYGFRDWRRRRTHERARDRGPRRRRRRRAQAPGLRHGVEIVAWVARSAAILVECDVDAVTRAQVDATPIRCPEPDTARG